MTQATQKALEALREATEIMARMYGPEAESLPPIQKNREAIAALEAEQAQADDAQVLVEGTTLYQLNAKGTNRWWASVQPGQDDEGKRISDEECQRVVKNLIQAAQAACEKTVCPYCESEWVTGEQHDRNLAAARKRVQAAGGPSLTDLVDKLGAVPEVSGSVAAQAVPAEPVAWGMRDPVAGVILDVICPEEHEAHEGRYTIPLYTSPQPVAVPQWIPVTERMPDDPQEVVFYSPDLRNPTEMLIGLYIRGEFKCAGHVWVNVTHWMPLPAAPGAAAPKEQDHA